MTGDLLEPAALDAAADMLTRLGAESLLAAGVYGLAAERYRAAAQALRQRERASARLLIWGARAESARAALAAAQAAEREQAGWVERARQVFAEARDAECASLDVHADPETLVSLATRARVAAEIASRQESALTDARLAREAAEQAVSKAGRRVKKARRKANRADRALAGPGPEAVLLALLPEALSGGTST